MPGWVTGKFGETGVQLNRAKEEEKGKKEMLDRKFTIFKLIYFV